MFKKATAEPAGKSSVASPPTRAAAEPRPAPPPAATPTQAAKPSSELTREAIAKLAFYKWEKRGCPTGQDQQDWYEAERELKSPQTAPARRG